WFGALMEGRTIAPWKKAGDFAALLGVPAKQPTVIAPASAKVLLALLDSNPLQGGYEAATGLVDNDQLIGLKAELDKKKVVHEQGAASDKKDADEKNGIYVARIAVVHHHVWRRVSAAPHHRLEQPVARPQSST